MKLNVLTIPYIRMTPMVHEVVFVFQLTLRAFSQQISDVVQKARPKRASSEYHTQAPNPREHQG